MKDAAANIAGPSSSDTRKPVVTGKSVSAREVEDYRKEKDALCAQIQQFRNDFQSMATGLYSPKTTGPQCMVVRLSGMTNLAARRGCKATPLVSFAKAAPVQKRGAKLAKEATSDTRPQSVPLEGNGDQWGKINSLLSQGPRAESVKITTNEYHYSKPSTLDPRTIHMKAEYPTHPLDPRLVDMSRAGVLTWPNVYRRWGSAVLKSRSLKLLIITIICAGMVGFGRAVELGVKNNQDPSRSDGIPGFTDPTPAVLITLTILTYIIRPKLAWVLTILAGVLISRYNSHGFVEAEEHPKLPVTPLLQQGILQVGKPMLCQASKNGEFFQFPPPMPCPVDMSNHLLGDHPTMQTIQLYKRNIISYKTKAHLCKIITVKIRVLTYFMNDE